MPELLPLVVALAVRWWRRRKMAYGRHSRRRGRHERQQADDEEPAVDLLLWGVGLLFLAWLIRRSERPSR